MKTFTFARDFAPVGIAHAAQANTRIARQFCAQNRFFHCARFVGIYYLWLIPVALQSLAAMRAGRRRALKN